MSRAIPQVRPGAERQVLEALKETVETLTARRPGVPRIRKLDANATLAQVVAKVNELIERLQV